MKDNPLTAGKKNEPGYLPKRNGLFILAILLLLSGGIAIFVGTHDYTIRSLGLAAVIGSTYLVRISNIHASPVISKRDSDFKTVERPGRLLWTISVALIPVLAVAFLYLYKNAIDGGHSALPAYVFAGVTLACTAVWSYLVSRMVG